MTTAFASAIPPPTLATTCPCAETRCPAHGDCASCVASHRSHQRHLPECMQPLIRDLVARLATRVECRIVEDRADSPRPPLKRLQVAAVFQPTETPSDRLWAEVYDL